MPILLSITDHEAKVLVAVTENPGLMAKEYAALVDEAGHPEAVNKVSGTVHRLRRKGLVISWHEDPKPNEWGDVERPQGKPGLRHQATKAAELVLDALRELNTTEPGRG